MSTLPYYYRPVGTQPHMLGGNRTQLTPLHRPLNLGQARASSQNSVPTNGLQRFPSPATHQYAYPIQRRRAGEAPTESARNAPHDAEDLLRRKTPGGILNGAYDGSLAGQEGRHASKHILLPSSSAGDLGSPMSGGFNGMEQSLPLRSPAAPHGNRQLGSGSWLNQQQQISHLTPDAIMNLNTGAQTSEWANQQFQQPQIDSMLNQIPVHYPSVFYQQSAQFIPNAMQPSPQTPSSPTVSNDQGPFGPYWPNGTYVPYRPAALRDPRYYPQSRSDWYGQTERGVIPPTIGSWDSSGVAPGLGGHPRIINGDQAQTPHTPFDIASFNHAQSQFDQAFTPGPQGYSNQTQFQPQSFKKVHAQPPSDYFTTPNAFQHNLPASTGLAGQLTPGSHDSQSQFPALEIDSLTAKAQHRDEIFSWAQHVYKELIAFIHHTRKANHQNKHGSGSHPPSRLSIFPRPPRHPSQESTPMLNRRKYERSTSVSQVRDQSNEQVRGHSSQGTGIAAPIPKLYQSKSTGWSSSDTHDPNALGVRRHSYQAQPGVGSSSFQGLIEPLDKYRTLRRMSGLSITHAMQSGYGGPVSPYGTPLSPGANAITALNKVTQLCQESNWKWIPGMLLAGCLAYGLGDHQQALNLYTQILDQDSK